MQQRTYSRLLGNARDSGPQGNEETQRSPFVGPATGQSNLPTALINAPTSLTNLAQLSGISLVPVNERRTTLNLSSNNSQIISYNGHQQPKITVNPRSRQNQPATIQRAPAVTNDPIREHPTYNLNTIPSIQLLNRVTTDHQRASRVSNVAPRAVDPKLKKFATSHSHPQHRLDNSNSYHRAFQNVPMSGRQSINRGEAPVFASEITIPCASDQQFSNTNSVQITASESSPNSGNDIGLLRLMAIFNNPALTITPIGPTSTVAQHHMDPNSRASISAVFPDKTRRQPQHGDLNLYLSSCNRSQNALSLDNFDIHENQTTKAEEVRHSFLEKKATIFVKNSDNPKIHHNHQQADQNSQTNPVHTVTLSWSPNNMTNNNLSDLELKTSNPAPIDPTRILEEFVAASQADHSSHLGQNEQPGHECLAIARKIDPKPLEKVARGKITSHRVYSKHDYQKPTKSSIISTKRRLYVPRTEKLSTKKFKSVPSFQKIEVETIEQDSYVSEHHRILAKLDEIAEAPSLTRSMAVQPCDTSVFPKDKFTSTIDAIMSDYEKKIGTIDLVEDDEAASINYEFSSQPTLINEVLVLPIQLPLDEELTEKKREHLSLLGLVSRHERNKIIAQQSEERLNNFSSLEELGHFSDVDGEVSRIVNTLIRAGGDKVSLRTDTDIKRNELPFIEGLNRNTSRIKMNFMNALGLEKRSKRTTLYKVIKPQEVMTANSIELQAHNDLITTVKNSSFNHVAETKYLLANASSKLVSPILKINQIATPNQMNRNGASSINTSGGSAEILRRAIKLAQASCREALCKAPNKDEYMKSLGLMAS